MSDSGALFERYVNGEHERVWDELHALRSAVRSLDHFDAVTTIARETMRRVRHNCEILIPRLESLGWHFGYDWAHPGAYAQERIAAAPAVLGEPTPPPVLDEIERRYGVLPLSFRAFYEVVGEINFVGTPFARPNWPGMDELDPMYIAGAVDIAEGQAGPGSGWVAVAPDPLVKYFIAGVGSTYIDLPQPRADAPIMFEGDRMYVEDRPLTLVRYLRYAMRGGGFLAFMPGSMWTLRPVEDLAFLTHDLLPI
jgi:hypothetical protein